MQNNDSVVAAILLSAFLLASFPNRLGGQARDSQSPASESQLKAYERDIAAANNSLLDASKDLDEITKSVNGTEFEVVLSIDLKAQQGSLALDTMGWLLSIYEHMECEPDRQKLKNVLKDRLPHYSQILGALADDAARSSFHLKSPAAVQACVRAKDDLRTAKNKLDEILASLH
jgi:hypothetical protein